jgi:hypothetical protein
LPKERIWIVDICSEICKDRMEEYQKIVNPLTRDEISPSMERNI